MKLEQIPGDYDNVDQRALELLKTNDYELAEYMRDYIKELYANIHMRDFYIRNLKDEILHTLKHRTVYSVSAMIKVTDSKEVKETVLAGLKRNKEKYGKKYCPCSLVRDEDTVCMCKEFREMEEGTCHCQLYVKTKE